jgi:hypothetical protein
LQEGSEDLAAQRACNLRYLPAMFEQITDVGLLERFRLQLLLTSVVLDLCSRFPKDGGVRRKHGTDAEFALFVDLVHDPGVFWMRFVALSQRGKERDDIKRQ